MVGTGRDSEIRAAKRQLRLQLRAQRALRSQQERDVAASALAERVLRLPELSSPGAVGCYVSTPAEPGTSALVDSLVAAGRTVLLPVVRADLDLEWAAYQPGTLVPGRLGIPQPAGSLLGVHAIQEAVVVICPGIAADETGARLGKGGGSYDRALARLPSEALRVVLLYDDEVLPAIPIAEHDQPVDMVITPRRTLRTAAAVR